MTNGYVKYRINGKQVYEHRVIYEKHFGKIPPKMQIHHKNGNRKDNRIENLELVSIGKHNAIHKSKPPVKCCVNECKRFSEKRKMCNVHYQGIFRKKKRNVFSRKYQYDRYHADKTFREKQKGKCKLRYRIKQGLNLLSS